MTQNVSVSVNLNSPPVAAPPRQGLYFVNQNTANCNIKIEPNQNHINLPNAQNINFNQQQMRHHNAAPSTNSSPHHTVDSPVGDQHKLTQQLQHQHLLRQQQLFKQQQQQQQQLQQSHQQQTQHQQHAQHHQQSQQHSQRHQQTPQQPASQQQSQTQQQQQQPQHPQLQQQMQHQIRQQQQQQQIPQQPKQMTSILRPPPPEYNVNGRQSNTQFQGLPCNVPQRLPQQNTNFSSGAILRPPNGGLPSGNRSFSEELMLMSANQRLNYHPPARMTGDMNPDWRHVVNSQQRNPQQAAFRTNFVQTPVAGIPVHNNNMNMMSGHLQQMPVRTMSNNEQQKQSISLQHTNYPVQLNLQMLQCMNSSTNNNGVSSASSQMYTQTGNAVGTHMLSTNSMSSHVTNNVPNLHQNTHRSPEVPPSLQNNTGAMNNCNSSNVNSMQDFNLDCLLEPDNDFYLNLSDFMQ